MGIGKDSANFAKRGITNIVGTIFILGLFVLIMYFGYKFLTTNYENNPYLGLMIMGLFIGDLAFIKMVGMYIDQVLLKRN